MQGLDRKRKTLFGDFVPGCLTGRGRVSDMARAIQLGPERAEKV
jgi:hypothetical protein